MDRPEHMKTQEDFLYDVSEVRAWNGFEYPTSIRSKCDRKKNSVDDESDAPKKLPQFALCRRADTSSNSCSCIARVTTYSL